MRLTLRTLLAYMDDILDPSDKEELAKKIESSEFAEDLIYRTQDTMRRLRLSAPQVTGTGMALDPNTVAEYLDNVLPPDNVGDFERICLESDVHLAEVASSHHVLTMVLGEPADIDPALRQRMYSAPRESDERKRLRIESAHKAAGASRDEVTAAAADFRRPATIAAPINRVGLPDYLRTSLWSRHRVALTTIAAVALVAVTAIVVSEFQNWRRGEAQPLTPLPADTVTEPPSLAAPSTEPTIVDGATGGDASVQSEPAELPSGQVAQPEAVVAGGRAVEPATPEIAPQPSDTSGVIASTGADSPRANLPSVADGGPLPSGAAAPVSAGGDASPSAADAAGNTLSPPIGTADTGARVAADTSGTAAADGDSAQPSEANFDLATYLGGNVVLLRYDTATGSWFRLASRSSVANGEALLALPAFRPTITLASGVHVDLLGGTRIVVRTAEASEFEGVAGADLNTPMLEVVYGRMVLINIANENNAVLLKLGATTAEARLARGATLAVELERSYVPGQDPRTSPSPLVARLYAPGGEIIWRAAGGEATIHEPAAWSIINGEVSEPMAHPTLPEWIDQEPVEQRSEQLYGAPVVQESLDYQLPADDQLLELFLSGRRREVKSLAARSSIHVGLFVPFVEALRDSEQRPNWRMHIEALRAAMALSPESANQVWRTLAEQRGETAAADLYEMLCGYSREQIGLTPAEIENGALARLINWLENDSLDYRVLAAHNLREITGKNLLPNPAGSLNERALGVRRWRERLRAGELMPVGVDRESD